MLTYLIQMIACSGILYGYYHFFLRNERFHQYNRFYLLFAMALSLLLPLLKIPVTIEDNHTNPVYAFVSAGETVVISASEQSFDYSHLWYALYGCMALLMISRLLLALLRIVRIKKAADTEKVENICLVKTHHPDAPFSFFRWLFWNKSTDIESDQGVQMFKHELYHIRSKHSRDLLFIEIVLSICWFNPFFLLYRKEVKTIQEFLADQYAAGNSDVASYAELLLMRAIGAGHQPLINPFFHNQLKRRITMLTSSKKPQYQWLRKLLVLPVAATAIALSAFHYEKEITNLVPDPLSLITEKITGPAVAPALVKKGVSGAVARDTVPAKTSKEITGNSANEVIAEYVTGNGRYRKLNPVTIIGFSDKPAPRITLKEGEMKVDVDAAFKGNWSSFLERNLDGQIPTEKGAPGGNYEVLVRFIVNEDGKVSDIEPLTNEGYGMEAEVMRVLKKSPEWHPAVNNKAGGESRPVKSYRIQPVNFQVVRKAADADETDPKNIGIVTPPASSGSPKKEPEVFTKVEVDAKYPGNWRSFLERNLDGQVAVDNGATPGMYTVITQFIVDAAGNVSDVKALTSVGYGMEQEAIRVIKKSGKWSPAIQNKREVKAYRKQPITFQVNEVPAKKQSP